MFTKLFYVISKEFSNDNIVTSPFTSTLLLLLRQAPRALEGDPTEGQHLLPVGARDYQRYVAGGHQGLGISAASVRKFCGAAGT